MDFKKLIFSIKTLVFVIALSSISNLLFGQTPEIKISGNSTEIADGDVSPSTTDNTDFDCAAVSGGVISKAFTIENTGTGALSLSGTPIVAVSGTNSTDFSVTQPSSSGIAASGSLTFTVEFDPSAAGTRTATLSIANDDSDENPYNFDITGFGGANGIVVTSSNDAGAGTLRQALADACVGAEITFSGVSTVTLTSGQLEVEKEVTINGGTGVAVQRSTSSGNFRVFDVNSLGTVTLQYLSIKNGVLTGVDDGAGIHANSDLVVENCVFENNVATDDGGAIYMGPSTDLTVSSSAFRSNGSRWGAGLYLRGTATISNSEFSENEVSTTGGAIRSGTSATLSTITNCTFYKNSADEEGGAIAVSTGTVNLINCTVSGNIATNEGGGVENSGGTVTIKNCVIDDNTSTSTGKPDLAGSITSNGYNLIGNRGSQSFTTSTGDLLGTSGAQLDAKLETLTANGGSTLKTMALGAGSIAINAGTATGAPTTDQIGQSRIGATDMGAYESQMPVILSVTSTDANGTYVIAHEIDISIIFDGAVTVTGTPQLILETGITDAIVDYSSGSGSATLVFTYKVQNGEKTSDLDVFSSSALSLNGGTLKSGASVNASLVLPAPGDPTSLGALKNIRIDGSAPIVSNITSTKTNGTYKAADVINVQVGFNEQVVVTGNPQLTLETGTTDRVVDYTSGSTTATLTFEYIVQAGDISADLDYTGTTALALNGGTIKDVNGNIATLTLPTPGGAGSLGNNKALVIDTDVPNAPSTPDLLASSDSGTSTTDDETNDDTPSFTGTAEANSTVEVFAGATSLGTTSADGSGDWSFTVAGASALSNGTYSITAKATDAANNTGSASSGLSITIDLTAPNAPATPDLLASSDSGTSDTDDETNDDTPSFEGTAEANSTVEVFAGATSLGTSTTDGSGDWTFTVAGASALSSGTYSIAAKATDVAGNTGSASTGLSITIDAADPNAPSTPDLLASSDSGPSDTDNYTADDTPSFEGTAEANSTVEVFAGATSLGTTSADGSGDWSLTVAGASALSNGTYSITAKATDAANNTGSASSGLSITIDLTAPNAPGTPDLLASSDKGSSDTDNETNDDTPSFDGTAEANSKIRFFVGATIIGKTSADGSGDWSFTVAGASALGDGDYVVKAIATDAAGNTSSASAGLNIKIDSDAPNAPSTPDLLASSDSGTSDTDDETNDDTPSFEGTAEANSTVEVFAGAISLGSSTADGSGDWSFTVPGASSLSSGIYSITAKATDVAGNTGSVSTGLSITIDATAPTAPSTPDLLASSDSWIDTDNYTSDDTPSFEGTAEANSTIEVFAGATSLGTTSADGSGDWTFTVAGASALSDGTYNITAKSTDGSNNTSLASTGLSITIDLTAPSAPSTPDLLASSDNGISDTDNETSDNTPSFEGTAEANSFLRVYADATLIGRAVVNGSGDWSLTVSGPPVLSDGTYIIRVVTADLAGNLGTYSPGLSITIDTDAPAALSTPDLLALSDNGTSDTDNETNDDTPSFEGTAEANSTVEVFAGATSIGTTSADGSGDWSFTVAGASALSHGTYSITAKATDEAGNTGAASSALSININTQSPTVNAVTSAKADGAYGPGTSIGIQVVFSEAVYVSGTPQIELETGSTDRTVDYDNGSASATLEFNYTVQNGDETTDLEYTGTSALSLNGGSITDAAGNSATLTLSTPAASNSLSDNKDVEIRNPEINVKAGGTTYASGSTYSFGKVGYGNDVKVEFTVENTGTTPLTFTGPNLASADFSITSTPSSPVGTSGSTKFEVTFSPSSNGLSTASLSISNNDLDESTYTINLSALVFVIDENDSTMLCLDGTDDFVEITDEAPFDLQSGFTVETWFKVNGSWSSNNEAIVSKGSNWKITRDGTNDALKFSVAGLATNSSVSGTTKVADGIWHHVTAIYSGTNLMLYIDGELDNSVAATGNATTNNDKLQIGALSGNDNFNGSIEETRIWNDVRSQVEIQERMNVAGQVSYSDLIGYYQYNSPSSTAVSDNSSGYDGVLKNGTKKCSSLAPVGKANVFTLTFNGTGTQTATGTGIAITMNSIGGTVAFVINRMEGKGNGTRTSSATNNCEDKYWLVRPYTVAGAGTYDVNICFDMDACVVSGLDSLNPSNYKMYKRNEGSDGAWAVSASGTEASPWNDQVCFSALTSFSQITIGTAGGVFAGAEIMVEQGATEYQDADTYTFSNTNVSQNTDVVFDITNLGVSNLDITTPLTALGDYSITSQPTDNIPGNSSSFTVRFTPSTTGVRTGSISIANNDADEDPFVLKLSGTGTRPVITSVASGDPDDTYIIGETVDVEVTFSQAVTVTGTPQIELETGTTDRTVDYSSGSGSNTLVFTYTVQDGDNSSDLEYTSVNALNLNSGSIKNGVTDATLDLPSLGTNSLADNSAIVIDGVRPVVVKVTSTKTDGFYNNGEVIAVVVEWDDDVVTTGTPQIELETGATDTDVDYTSGSNSQDLTFSYTVGANDQSLDLDYTGTTALSLNGGTIKDVNGNIAILTLAIPANSGSLGDNKNLVIDNISPTVTSVTSSTSNGSYKAGDNIDIVINFSEDALVTGTPQIELETGTTDRNANYLSGSGSDAWTFRYTVQSGDISSDLAYTGTSALSLNAGSIKDAAGNDATLTLATPGNANSLSDNKDIIIDTDAPNAPIYVSISTDSGVSGTDEITSDKELQLTGTAEASSSVELFIGAGSIGSVTANGTGNWTFDYTGTTLAEGDYTFTAKATDAAGNTSLASSDFDVSIDATAPNAPTLASISTDSGRDNADKLTNDQSLTISGSAEANSYVEVFLGATSQTTVTTDGIGKWSYTHGSSLAEGIYMFTATATDAAGNTGSTSSNFRVSIDITAPGQPAFTGMTTDTGRDLTDGLTSDQELIFAGTAEAHSLVEVYDGATKLGGVNTNASGVWTFDFSATSLNEGVHMMTVYATDSAGNVSIVSDNNKIRIDITKPSVPAITGISTDSGVSASDKITKDQTLLVNGTAEADAQIELFNGVTSLGTFNTNSSGSWIYDYTSTSLAAGSYTFTATAMDSAGNTSSTSSGMTAVIDTTVPKAVSISSTNTDDEYNEGSTLTITMEFPETVVVSGTPTLELETGANDAIATYSGGSNSKVLSFTYKVASQNTSADLENTSITALTLGAATIADIAGNNADTDLPKLGGGKSLADNKDLVINAKPTITTVANQDWCLGETVKSSFAVGDIDDAITGLVITATSSNTTLIKNSNISITGSGASKDLAIVPSFGQYGTATITIKVEDDNGSSESIQFTATVRPRPMAAFIADTICQENFSQFTDKTTIAQGNVVAWSWDFDDTNISSSQSPKHLYTNAGTYTVEMIATSDKGCKDTATFQATVYPKPIADFEASIACEDQRVQFIDSTKILTGSIVNYAWNFGNVSTSAQQNPGNVYKDTGVFETVLIVSTDKACKDTIAKNVDVNPNPVAKFTVGNVCSSDSAAFVNGSTLSAGTMNHNWSFGDSTKSIVASPKHLYKFDGYYQVKLAVTTDDGCQDSVTRTMQVYESPTVSFSANSVCDNESMTFTNNTSGAASYEWTFGDGTTSTAKAPSHTYATDGSYDIKLIAISASGCKDSIEKKVTVYPLPVAAFASSAECLTDTTQFTNNSTGANTHAWNFGNGSSSNLETPNHLYGKDGSYTVTLITTSSNGCKDTVSNTITVNPLPQVAIIINDTCDGKALTIANSTTGANAYAWTYGDGNGSNSMVPTHTYSSDGKYDVKLIATTSLGCQDSASTSIEIFPLPQVSFTQNNVCDGAVMDFKNGSSISKGVNAFAWNFGDGAGSVNTSPSHTYGSDGSYAVRLVATSNQGCQDSVDRNIRVFTQPKADFTSANECFGQELDFSNATSITTNTNWSFGDGTTSSIAAPSHLYAAAGVYDVKLTTETTDGCIDSVTKSFTVYRKPIAGFVHDSICLTEDITFTNTSYNGVISTYKWYFGDGDSADVASPRHEYGSNGSFTTTLIVTTDDGCKDTVISTPVVHPLPITRFVANDVCLYDSLKLANISTIATGTIARSHWEYSDGINASGTDETRKFVRAGTFKVSLTSTSDFGCETSADTLVSINDIPDATFAVDSNCFGFNTKFKNGSAIDNGTVDNYNWTFGDGNSSTDINPVHFYRAANLYTVQLVAASNKGCTDTVGNNVRVYAKPVSDFTATTVCYGVETEFTNASSDAINHKWNFADGSGSSSLENPDYTYMNPGDYDVTLYTSSENGCLDTVTKTVTVYELPVAIFTVENHCFADDFVPTESSLGDLSDWDWNYGDGNTSTDQDPVHVYAKDGDFIVNLQVTSTDGCLDSVKREVTVHPLPVMNVRPDTVVSKGYEVPMWAEGGVKYEWSPAVWLDDASTRRPIATVVEDVTYTVTITTEFGCVNDTSVSLISEDDYTMEPSNIITPDGNGKNDYWIVDKAQFYNDVEVIVFDRWGRVVFTSTAYDNTWDATVGGTALPDGVYYYIIKVPVERNEYKGSITIFR